MASKGQITDFSNRSVTIFYTICRINNNQQKSMQQRSIQNQYQKITTKTFVYSIVTYDIATVDVEVFCMKRT